MYHYWFILWEILDAIKTRYTVFNISSAQVTWANWLKLLFCGRADIVLHHYIIFILLHWLNLLQHMYIHSCTTGSHDCIWMKMEGLNGVDRTTELCLKWTINWYMNVSVLLCQYENPYAHSIQHMNSSYTQDRWFIVSTTVSMIWCTV